MSSVLERLRQGQRCWPAEVGLRALGIVLLVACSNVMLILHRFVTTPPTHEATVAEFVLCAVGFIALTSGLAFTVEGPGLFRWVPIPTRSLIP